MVRQLADEAHGVGDQRVVALAHLHHPRGGVERGEEPVLHEDVGARERPQDRRLARVGVAHERRLEDLLAPLALGRPLARHAGQVVLQAADLVADHPPVGLQLRLTRAAHSDAAPHAREVRPHPREPRQHVLQLRQLHLHPRLRGARARGEDVQDQLRTVHDPRADELLQVLALRRRELLVEDHQGGPALLHPVAQLLRLPLPHVEPRVRRVQPLRQGAHHLRSGGVGQPPSSVQVLLHGPERHRLHRRADQHRPLAGCSSSIIAPRCAQATGASSSPSRSHCA